MNFKKLLRGSAYAFAVMLTPNAYADSTQWIFNNVVFNDGGTLIGEFTTDSVTGNLLSYNLTTTAGSLLEGNNYNASDSFILGNAYGNIGITAIMISANWKPNEFGYIVTPFELYLAFYNSPAIWGNLAFSIINNSYAYESNPNSLGTGSVNRYISSGSVSAVPVPSAILLFGSALVGFIGVNRRKTI
jgi:hypothetical protein